MTHSHIYFHIITNTNMKLEVYMSIFKNLMSNTKYIALALSVLHGKYKLQ